MAKKTCPECNTKSGTRTIVCVECGYEFVFSKVAKKIVKKDEYVKQHVIWTELSKNDTIYVEPNTGPYWQLRSGLVEYLGESGVFKVAYLCKKGIHAYPIKHNKAGGHRFIYMGDYNESNIGVVREPHIIYMVDKNV